MARGRVVSRVNGVPVLQGEARPATRTSRTSRGGSSRRRGRGRGRGHAGTGSFLGVHSGRQAGAVANAEAGAEFNPGIRQGREEAKGSRKREQDLGAWYRQLVADYQGAAQTGAAALKSVEDTTTKQLGEAAERSSADQAALASQDEAFAKLVGGPKDTAGLSKIAQAGAAAERARVDQAKLPISEQGNFVARVGADSAAARLRGIEARGEERNRRDKILSDVAAQRKEKGGARVAAKEKIRESDRDYALNVKQAQLAQREARSAEQQAAADAALARIESARKAQQDAISNRQEQERIGISRKNARTSARSQRATARHYRKENKGGLTPAERRSRGEHAHDAMSAAKAQLAIKVPKSAKEWAKFESALIEKLGSSYSAEAARAVAKLRRQQSQKRQGAYNRRVRKGLAAGPPTPKRFG